MQVDSSPLERIAVLQLSFCCQSMRKSAENFVHLLIVLGDIFADVYHRTLCTSSRQDQFQVMIHMAEDRHPRVVPVDHWIQCSEFDGIGLGIKGGRFNYVVRESKSAFFSTIFEANFAARGAVSLKGLRTFLDFQQK